jgi:hypothetical protein
MKGYRTILVGLLMAIAPAGLGYLLSVNWNAYLSPEAAFAISGVLTIAMRVVTTTPVAQAVGKLCVAMLAFLLVPVLALLMLLAPSRAADMPLASIPLKARAQALQPIPTNGCGYYVGLNTMGAASAMANNLTPGAQIVQGEFGATLGYTCNTASNAAFWFAEGSFDVTNLNGQANGLSLTGPAHFEQRFGFGATQFGSFLSFFPALGSLSTPSLPVLPAGVTAGPASPYLYGGINEQDISARLGLASNTVWAVSPAMGIGMQYRLSNSLVADTFAGWRMSQDAICIGSKGCGSIGNGVEVGFILKY